MDGSRLLDALDLCYAAMQDPAAFQTLTETLAADLGAEAGDLVIEHLGSGEAEALGSLGFDPAFRETYDAEHLGENPWFDNLRRQDPGRFHTDATAADGYWTSAYFNDWVRPQGFRHDIGAALEASRHHNIWIGFTRSETRGPFYDAEALDRILPHLRRVIAFHLEHLAAREERTQLRSLLDAFSVPVALLERSGAVSDMNGACSAYLDGSRDLTLSRAGRLMAIDGRSDARLGAAIHRAASTLDDPAALPPDPVVIGAGREDPAALHVFPVRGGSDGARGRVAVAIVRIGLRQSPDIRGVEKAFRLTRTEADLAAWIGGGHPVSEFAEARGISIGTARWHLKNLEDKTGCSRAAELAAMIAASRNPLRRPS